MNSYTGYDRNGYVNRVEDMDDPTLIGTALTVDVEDFMDTTMWMKAYVEQHKRHETMRTSWAERQKIAATFGRSHER